MVLQDHFIRSKLASRGRSGPQLEALEGRIVLSTLFITHTIQTMPNAYYDATAAVVGHDVYVVDSPGDPFGSPPISVYDADTLTWSSIPLPTSTFGAYDAAGVSDQVVFSDGADVNIYNTQTQTWTQDQLSVARGYFFELAVGDKVLFVGGYADQTSNSNGGDTNIAEVYDSVTGTISTHQLSGYTALDFTGIAVVGDEAIITGEYTGSSLYGDEADVYNADTNQWTPTTLPAADSITGAATVGTLAIFTGLEGATYIYNATTSKWSTGANFPAPKELGFIYSGAGVGNKAVFSGNTFGDVYDPASNNWTMTKLGVQYVGPRSIAAGGEFLYDSGTPNDPSAPDDIVYLYNASTNRWSLSRVGEQVPGAALVSLGDQIMIIGGETEQPDGINEPGKFVDVYTISSTGAAAPVGNISKVRLPSAVRRGTGGVAQVRVTNRGTAPLPGPFYVDVYAVPTRSFGIGAVLLGGERIPENLPVGNTLTPRINLTVPANMALGSYHLALVVRQGRTTNVLTSDKPTFAVAASASLAVAPENRHVPETELPAEGWLQTPAWLLRD